LGHGQVGNPQVAGTINVGPGSAITPNSGGGFIITAPVTGGGSLTKNPFPHTSPIWSLACRPGETSVSRTGMSGAADHFTPSQNSTSGASPEVITMNLRHHSHLL
jgi:hypothetical protein